ncbi:MAG: Rid family detoxifying hydrolase [Armatimonadota bacterium]
MELWQRFSHRARRAILIAHDEASQMRQSVIGTEHILLGLARLGEGAAAEILRTLNVDLAELRDDVERRAARGTEESPSREISFTPEAQHVLQRAYSASREMSSVQIGTEHILLGLAQEAPGATCNALRKHGVSAAKVGEAILTLDRDEGEEPASDPPRPAGQAVAAARELLRRAHNAAGEMQRNLTKAHAVLDEIAEAVEDDQALRGSATMTRETLSNDRIPPAVGPYSQAVRAGEMIFCSGVIGLDPETKELVQESFEAQVRRVLENLTMLLEDCGSGLAHVVKTTVFLVDMTQFATFNGIYAEYFGEEPPARSTVQVAALPLGAQIEVEAIALAQS